MKNSKEETYENDRQAALNLTTISDYKHKADISKISSYKNIHPGVVFVPVRVDVTQQRSVAAKLKTASFHSGKLEQIIN